MKKYKFKTSINSKNDLEIFNERFKETKGIIDWNLIDKKGNKILIVTSKELGKEEISKKIFEAGFTNEPIMSLGEKIFYRLTHKDCCNRLNR